MKKLEKLRKPMVVIGLTGSIGMGKSTAADILRQMGFPIYSADKAVHDLLKKNGKAVAPVTILCPESFRGGAINRKILGRTVFAQPKKLRRLERIIHPLLRHAECTFLQKARKNKVRAAILEIPLLFETGAEKRCDITLCVTASHAIQKARVLSRPGMTEEKLRAILKRQISDAEKRRRADFVIPTGKGLETTEKHLRKLLRQLDLLF